MRIKNLYECNENCKSCSYEFKKPTGYTIMDECCTDKCPHNNYKIGNVDKLGGRHVEGYGWNPLGEYCKECNHENCEDCVKWSNRDKKLRNNIPPVLKTPPVTKVPTKTEVPAFANQTPTTIADTKSSDIPMVEKISENIPPQNNATTELVAKVKEIIGNNGISPSQIDRPVIRPNNPFDFDDFDKKETKSLFDDFDADDVDSLFGHKTVEPVEISPVSDIDFAEKGLIAQENSVSDELIPSDASVDIIDIQPDEVFSSAINNSYNSELNEDVENEDREENFSDDIDFGMGDSYSDPDNTFDEYDNVSFDGDDDYEIPMPDEYMEDLEILANAQKEMYRHDEDDDDDDDFDEDDDAEFELFEQTKKLKHSILFAPETKIARYQVRNKGVYLSVSGEAKVTVKGRNDSDGFSYCDANRFPRYVREGILSGELYENPNIEITDNTTFNFVYFEIEGDEVIQKNDKTYVSSIENASEDKIRKLLKKAFDELSN
jgi:hypothetical protein